MKLIAIKRVLIERFSEADPEVLIKDHRPTVLIVRLKYRGKNQDFAVPLRSNIAPDAQKDDYFALPNRSTTKPNHHHGLHYIKMFPVSKKFYELYRTEGDVASKLYLAFIDKHEKEIVNQCQAYLERFEKGICPPYCTDIDKLIEVLNTLI